MEWKLVSPLPHHRFSLFPSTHLSKCSSYCSENKNRHVGGRWTVYTTKQNQHLICPTGQKDLGQESWGIWGKEKRLSPSKNYQVLTTSLGKNLPPSLLPEDEGKYNRISTCGKACLYRSLFSGELPTINQHSLSYLFHSPHLWSAPWKNQPKINKESNSVRANQQLAT